MFYFVDYCFKKILISCILGKYCKLCTLETAKCLFNVFYLDLANVPNLVTLRSGDTVTNDRIERCCYC